MAEEPNVEDPEEDVKEDEEPEIDEEPEEDEEDEEEKESEEGDDKEDEEELELARVSFREIKEKHPSFFKDFPSLKHAFFREQQFTEIFPTIEDAKKAAEDQAAYAEITESVLEGDASKFLNELKSENPESLETFTNNFLPALQEASSELYYRIMAPRVQASIRDVYLHGKENKDENAQNAAKVVHKLLFGGDYNDVEKEINTGKFSPNGKGKPDSQLEQDKRNFYQTKYNNLFTEVGNLCYSKLDDEIAKGLSDLDKGNKGLKRVLMSDIKNKVLAEMDKDTTHLNRMKQLWKREERNGFAGQLKDSFQTIFMAKAKTLIPKIRLEARKEVLGKNFKGKEGGKEPTRLTGGKEGKTSGKAMTAERARTEKLTTRQVFDD